MQGVYILVGSLPYNSRNKIRTGGNLRNGKRKHWNKVSDRKDKLLDVEIVTPLEDITEEINGKIRY